MCTRLIETLCANKYSTSLVLGSSPHT